MLVDDNKIDLLIHAKLISIHFPDFNIIEFQNADAALNYLKISLESDKHFHIVPDFILLDLVMPCKDGYEFIKEYMSISFPKKRIPKLIILTCSINPKDYVKCKKFPTVCGFLIKPLLKKNLNQMFSELILKDEML